MYKQRNEMNFCESNDNLEGRVEGADREKNASRTIYAGMGVMTCSLPVILMNGFVWRNDFVLYPTLGIIWSGYGIMKLGMNKLDDVHKAKMEIRKDEEHFRLEMEYFKCCGEDNEEGAMAIWEQMREMEEKKIDEYFARKKEEKKEMKRRIRRGF